MMSTKLKIFNVQTLILFSIVLAALCVQPTFGGGSGTDSDSDDGSASKGSSSGSASVEDGKSTNSGQKGSCRLSGESKSGSGEDCLRQNETNCLVSCSRDSGEAENCDLDEYDEAEFTTTTLAPTTSGAVNSTVNSTSIFENATFFGECTCKLLDGIENLTQSSEFTEEQKGYLRTFKIEIQLILTGGKCKKAKSSNGNGNAWGKWKEHRCKLKKVLKQIKKFKAQYSEIWEICEWKEIEGYGSFIQAEYAIKTVCAQDSSAEIVVTETSNCTICDAFDQLAEEETQDMDFKADCKQLSFQLRIVFKYKEWDNSQRKGWAWGHIKRLMKKHPNKKQKVMDCEFGDSGDDVESFGEGADIYEKVQGLPDILSGSVDDCPLLKAMRKYYANESSASVDKRKEMKQLCDKLSAFFVIHVSVSVRLSYCSAQFYQFLLIAPGMKKELLTLKIFTKESDEEPWGTCMDISFSESFCSNFGCGNKTGGPGKFPAQSDRGRLITPDSSNNTYFFTAFLKGVSTLTTTQKLQVSSSTNSIKACIWSKNLASCPSDDDKKPGSECRVGCVSSVISKISVSIRVKITVVQIETWYGEKTASNSSYAPVSSFCGCN